MQWKNTNSIIYWLQYYDIKDYYPSITDKTLQRSITFAKQYVNIPEDNIRIINHCRKSLLFNNNVSWKKKLKR